MKISCRIVSLPRVHSDAPDASVAPVSSLSHSTLSSTQATTQILSPEEEADLERMALQDDRRIAIQELSVYKNEPREVSDRSQPFNIVRFWDVSEPWCLCKASQYL
jgi:hypothetical protein